MQATQFLGAWPFDKDAVFADANEGAPIAVGTPLICQDEYWGYGEFLMVKWTSTSALAVGTLVTLDENLVPTAAPSTANTGRPLFIVASRFPADSTTSASNPLYGYVMKAGRGPVTFSVAATTGAAYLGTAGNATPTAAAGKQIVGAVTLIAATGTITKSVRTQNGSNRLIVPNKLGLYPGVAVSGTGIAGGTTITTLDSGRNNEVILSANATATGTVTGTFTNTGFGIVQVNNPCVQTQIT